MATHRLTLEYDGTDFHGWQTQPGVRTVAGVLRDAVHQVSGEHAPMTAAGRTDAGAHAHAQVVGIELQRAWEPSVLQAALNAVLPADVVVVGASRCESSFDARRDAVSRTYRYVVAVRDQRAPIERRHAWQVRGPLDLEAMRHAATLLTGTHDFGAFGGPTTPGGTTVRTVHSVVVEAATRSAAHPDAPQLALISVSANAFLRGMMRAFAGALVAVGQGRRDAQWVAELLGTTTRHASLTVAPARGLHQWAVTYA